MNRTGKFGFAVSLILLLAACAPEMHRTPPRDISVNTVQMDHRVQFEARRTALSSAEAESLSRFLAKVPALATQHAVVEAAASPKINGERVSQVRAMLLGKGIPVDVIEVKASPTLDANEVRVWLEYAVAGLESCPSWMDNSEHNFENAPMSHHGCAVTRNLSRQVADPMDFKKGTGDPRISNDRSNVLLDRYRKVETQAAPSASTAGGSE